MTHFDGNLSSKKPFTVKYRDGEISAPATRIHPRSGGRVVEIIAGESDVHFTGFYGSDGVVCPAGQTTKVLSNDRRVGPSRSGGTSVKTAELTTEYSASAKQVRVQVMLPGGGWGESAIGESVSPQTVRINGRDYSGRMIGERFIVESDKWIRL